MGKEVNIEKMVLNIEGEKVSLTIEQAKKLKGILDELFGKEIIKEVVKEKHHYHDYYYRPYIYKQWEYPTYPIVYCSTSKSLEVTF